ncbi:glutamate-cysteine ligase family protein [Phycicoccus sp. Soil748]|uniref:glutamate-cysteine ligase family protein n=1 Tax=Phycicoccus sp. Soil748 TaxID=1736397 RepID=UPI0007030D34|nr:glutamate-cysteine ligase family protein [Phycicoccus sp. Soil748]KRE52846.1 hypothetical protein ASG70_16045 [Phycicoccus sp. Soil748]
MTTSTDHRPVAATAHVPDDAVVSLHEARELVRSLALHDQPVGTVGLEVEGHTVVRRDVTASPPYDVLLEVATRHALLPRGGRVTLEPGGQLEVSSAPHPDLATALDAMEQDTAVVRAALAQQGLGWVLLGADPVRPPRRVNPGERYAAMEAWFSAAAATQGHGATMMCSTAALQVNLQAGSRDQWSARVGRAQGLAPLLTALSGSSTFLEGRDTGWHSARQRAWSGLGELRAGRLPHLADPVEAWAERALEAEVVLVPAAPGGVAAADERRSLRQWITAPRHWPPATAGDVRRQLTTLFPPVRLRGWLELRCLDVLPSRWWPAVAALATVWMDDESLYPVVDEAAARTADRAQAAARSGLADPVLRAAATSCLRESAGAVPEQVRDAVAELADLASDGRSPGTLVTDDLRGRGPAVVMEEMAHA